MVTTFSVKFVSTSFSLACLGSTGDQDQPTLTECLGLQGLERRINIPQEIGTNDKIFGTLLLEDRTGERVNAIIRRHMNNAEKVNVTILEEWIAGRGKYPVTWKTLTETLCDIGLTMLAGEIAVAKLHSKEQLCELGKAFMLQLVLQGDY